MLLDCEQVDGQNELKGQHQLNEEALHWTCPTAQGRGDGHRAGEHGFDDEAGYDGPDDLCGNYQNTTDDWNCSGDDEADGDGGVELTSRDAEENEDGGS
jgi:hypothetical protein